MERSRAAAGGFRIAPTGLYYLGNYKVLDDPNPFPGSGWTENSPEIARESRPR
jgi:hypothetical protein